MAQSYTFEDLSGSTSSTSDNPYDGLIEACHNNASEIQTRYLTHRTTRTTQQRAKLLAPDFPGVTIDPILLRLTEPSNEPGYTDPRHCLVFWARPPQKIKDLVAAIQARLAAAAPQLWLMPQTSLHLTALEITHSLTAPEIAALVQQVAPAVPTITDYTLTHRARLIKPTISYDAQALALSFVPAAGEALPQGRTAADDAYTHHHLRRDLYALVRDADVGVDSRYVVPSAHLTIGRFIHAEEFEAVEAGTGKKTVDRAKMAELVRVIVEMNEWLEREFWPKEGERIKDGGEWIVGEDKGLDCRSGALWYGGGETYRLGKGF